MVRLRLLPLSLATLALLGARPALASPINPNNFTGNVNNDFPLTNPDVRVVNVLSNPVQIGQPAWMTQQGLVSGWALKDVRASYDANTDVLSVGVGTFNNAQGQPAIIGDADGSGNPAVASAQMAAAGGVKYANLGGHESVSIGFASDSTTHPGQPGPMLVVAGVPAFKTQPDNGFPQFTVAQATGGALGYNYGQTLTNNLGSLAFNPSAAHPGFEFTIKNFSKIPGIDPTKGFWISAYAGSPDDVVVGESGQQLTRVPAFAGQEVPEPTTILAWTLVAGGALVGLRRPRRASHVG
jgi:hypothetical protein